VASKTYLLVAVGFFVSFSFYPTNFLRNIISWISGTLNYQNYAAIGVLEPVNVSMKSTIDLLFNIFGDPASATSVNAVCYFVFISAVLKFNKSYRNRAFQHNLLLAALLPILFVGTTFQYYLILLLVPLIFFCSEPSERTSGAHKLEINRVPAISYLIFILALTPLALPWSLFTARIPEGWSNISASWLVSQAGLTLLGLALYFLPARRN
jgi:hypothetical protein